MPHRFAVPPALFAAALLPLAPMHGLAVHDTTVARIEVNRIGAVASNLGSFGLDLSDPARWDQGFEYPRGSGITPFLDLGLWVTGRVAGEERNALAEYRSEFRPGPMLGGGPAPWDPAYGVYRVTRGDTTGWAAWLARAAPLGAPVSAAGDAPAMRGSQMLWAVYNDADPAAHDTTYGLRPLGLEVRQATWAFHEAGPRDDAVVFEWRLENRGAATIDSAYVAVWADPDVGDRADLMACDPALGLAYDYDPPGGDALYGAAPPAFGVRLLAGARARPGGPDLGATAIAGYVNGDDPVGPDEIASLLRGRSRAGAEVIDPTTGQPTRYRYAGDPRAGTGWLDAVPADKKFLIASGPFTMAPGDTQVVRAALVAGAGADRLASVDSLYAVATADFDAPPAAGGGPPAGAPGVLAAWPVPARGAVAFRFTPRAGARWTLDVHDLTGRRVARVAEGSGDGTAVTRVWVPPDAVTILTGAAYARAPWPRPGVYWAVLTSEGSLMTRRIVLVGR